jgi:hypothetical protein
MKSALRISMQEENNAWNDKKEFGRPQEININYTCLTNE